MEFDTNGLKQRARFFFFEVEVGVAGDAEGSAGEDLISAIHATQMLGDQVVEKEVVVCAVGIGQADEAGQGAGNSDHSQDLRA